MFYNKAVERFSVVAELWFEIKRVLAVASQELDD
jgi:hypothetical protein